MRKVAKNDCILRLTIKFIHYTALQTVHQVTVLLQHLRK